MTCEEMAALIPAYALEALDEDEAGPLREHLTSCEGCRRELAGCRQVADGLALAVPPRTPRPALRGRVLAEAGVTTARRARPSLGGMDAVRRWLEERVWPTAVRLSPAVAAVALVVAAGLAWQAARLQASLDQERAANRVLAEQLAARDTLVVDLLRPGLAVRELRGTEAAPAARASVFLNPQSRTALLTAADLPALPKDKVYQLWLIRDGRRTSGGLMVPDQSGQARLTISAPDPLSAYQGVGITIEPSGGSPGPTGPRVLGGSL